MNWKIKFTIKYHLIFAQAGKCIILLKMECVTIYWEQVTKITEINLFRSCSVVSVDFMNSLIRISPIITSGHSIKEQTNKWIHTKDWRGVYYVYGYLHVYVAYWPLYIYDTYRREVTNWMAYLHKKKLARATCMKSYLL